MPVGADRGLSRREIVSRAAVAASGAVIVTSLPLLLSVRSAFAQASSDPEIVASAVWLEKTMVFAYDRLLARARLTGHERSLLMALRGQEQEHAGAMTNSLREVGGGAPAATANVTDVERIAPGLRGVRDGRQALAFANQLEAAAIAAYVEAIQNVKDGSTLQTMASIMSSEGQHRVVLRVALSQDPLPSAFEAGRAATTRR